MLLALCPRLCPRWPILGTPCLGQTFSFPAFTTTFVVKKNPEEVDSSDFAVGFFKKHLQLQISAFQCSGRVVHSPIATPHPTPTQFLLHPVCVGLVEIESLTSYRKDKKKVSLSQKSNNCLYCVQSIDLWLDINPIKRQQTVLFTRKSEKL